VTYDARTLIGLIRDLDAQSIGGTDIEYLDVLHWNTNGRDTGGCTDETALAIFRALLREKLGTFPLAEIGAAVLAQIDRDEAGS